MKRIELSVQKERTVEVLSAFRHDWLTADDIVTLTDGNARTVRTHLQQFARAGLVECIPHRCGYRYRWRAEKRLSRLFENAVVA